MKKVILSLFFLASFFIAFSQVPPIRETSPKSLIGLDQRKIFGLTFGYPTLSTPPVLRPSLLNGGPDSAGVSFFVKSDTAIYVYVGGGAYKKIAAGGAVNLDSLRDAISITVVNAGGTSSRFLSADTLNGKAGVQTPIDKKKVQRNEYPISYAEMRVLASPQTQVFYHTKIYNIYSDFYWDATSTDADDSVMTVKITAITTGRLKRFIPDGVTINPKWFGVVGDGVTDDWRAMQKCIDWAIQYKTYPRILIPSGFYVLSHGLLIRKDVNNDGASEYVSMEISGAKSGYNTALSDGGETILICNDSTDFGIGVQRGKGVIIRNLVFRGLNLAPNNVTGVNIGLSSTSFLTSGIRNNLQSPNSGIAIDPFCTSALASINRYPFRTGLYGEVSTGGSTDITIDNCVIRNFAVGIMISPTGITQNGEVINIEHNWIDYNKVSIAIGQAQSRTVVVNDFKCWGGAEAIFDCRRYGSGTGSSFGTINDINIAGTNRFLLSAGNFGLGTTNTISNSHIENLYAIGGNIVDSLTGRSVIVLKNCQTDLTGEFYGVTHKAPVAAWCNTFKVEDGYFGHYSIPGTDILVSALLIEQDNCAGNPIVPSTLVDYDKKVFWRNSEAAGLRGIGIQQAAGGGVTSRLYKGLEVYKHLETNTYGTSGITVKSKYLGNGYNIFEAAHTATVFSVDSPNNRIVITVNSLDDYKFATGANVFSSTGPIGIIDSINTTTHRVYLKYTSSYILPGNTYSTLWVGQTPYVYQNFAFSTGNITSGSPYIKSVLAEQLNGTTGSFQVGMFFNHPAFPAGSYIKAITSDSLLISSNATYSKTGSFVHQETRWATDIFNQSTTTNPYDRWALKEGDVLHNGITTQDSTVLYAVYTPGFWPTGTPLATFVGARSNSGGGSGGTDSADVAGFGVNITKVGNVRTFKSDTANGGIATLYNVNKAGKTYPFESTIGATYNNNLWNGARMAAEFLPGALSSVALNGNFVQVTSSNIAWGGASITRFLPQFPSLLPYKKIEVDYAIVSALASNIGFGPSFYSNDTHGANFGYTTYLATSTSTATPHFAKQDGTGDQTGTTFPISQGDVIRQTIEFRDSVAIATFQNITTGSAVSTITKTFVAGTAPYVANTGTWAFQNFSGTYEIRSAKVSSINVSTPTLMVAMDSKGQINTTSFAGRFASLLNSRYPTVVNYSGGGDLLSNLLEKRDEVNRLNPEQVLIGLGSNDIRFGATVPQTMALMEKAVAMFKGSSTRWAVTVVPEDSTGGGVGLTALKNALVAAYPSNYVDLWTFSSTSNKLKAGYNSGDGVHPNQAWNTAADSAIAAQGFFSIQSVNRRTPYQKTDGNIAYTGDSAHLSWGVARGFNNIPKFNDSLNQVPSLINDNGTGLIVSKNQTAVSAIAGAIATFDGSLAMVGNNATLSIYNRTNTAQTYGLYNDQNILRFIPSTTGSDEIIIDATGKMKIGFVPSTGTISSVGALQIRKSYTIASSIGKLGAALNIDTTTMTMPSAGLSDFAMVGIAPVTLTSGSAGSHTNAYTVYIDGAPIAGTNQTITNPWALYLKSGKTHLGTFSNGSNTDSLLTTVNGELKKIAQSSISSSDTSIHIRNFSTSSATTYNVDTLYFTGGVNELLQITCRILAHKSTGEAYSGTKTMYYNIISGTVTDGTGETDRADQYIPTGGLTGYTFAITRTGVQVYIQVTSVTGTITGTAWYQVIRKNN